MHVHVRPAGEATAALTPEQNKDARFYIWTFEEEAALKTRLPTVFEVSTAVKVWILTTDLTQFQSEIQNVHVLKCMSQMFFFPSYKTIHLLTISQKLECFDTIMWI